MGPMNLLDIKHLTFRRLEVNLGADCPFLPGYQDELFRWDPGVNRTFAVLKTF